MRQLVTFLVIFSAFFSVQAQMNNEICSMPKNEGTAAEGIQPMVYYYYDNVTDQCDPFMFYGAGGNANRFNVEKYCMRNCSSSGTALYPIDETEACHFKKEVGKCLSNYLRYYYDPIHRKCKTFFWTGCVGNGNRFLDSQACNKTCYGIADPGEGPEEDEYDTPVALILGVVFGLVGTAILVAIIVLAIKSKEKSKKAPKEEDTARQAMQGDEDVETAH
ncbi:BPTI/Kunitz domain-containing protein [Alosa sapidissima]|uniref:BPTI/Kunitz domain-containing protein n=1 Tax=Alosa sapidissima TaxID=34773 RepID=UPI001C097A14|nr:BPTI/Kunitz domain-containing protein [Alosa sapidissima]